MKEFWGRLGIFLLLLGMCALAGYLAFHAKGPLDFCLSLVSYTGFALAAGYAAMRRAS